MKWRWPPWSGQDGRNGNSEQAQRMLDRANDVVRRTEDQEDRVQEVTRRAHEMVRRTARFTQEVDRALHIRGTP
jgi:ABC-type transporter Mla subunit MlaD